MLKTLGIPLLVGVVSALATLAAVHYLPPSFWPGTSPEASEQNRQPGEEKPQRLRPEQVTALGRLEPEDGVIEISGPPGDRVAELKVHVGDHVKQGDTLAVLESRSLRQAELDLAEAQLQGAEERGKAEEKYAAAVRNEAELARKQSQLERLELASQQAKLAGVKASLKSAEDDLDRLEALRSDSSSTETEIVSEQQLEHQKAAVEKARQDFAAAQTQLKKLSDSIELADQQAEAKVKTAEANEARIPSTLELNSLQKSAELARRRLELTTIRAPSDGEILKVSLSQGETIAQQPILEMADTSRMVAVAEIYEDDALRVQPGVSAEATSEALDQPLRGTVSYIGSMISKNSVMSLTPTASADLRVVEARIRLEPSPEARRLINLQVTVTIPVGSSGTRDENGARP